MISAEPAISSAESTLRTCELDYRNDPRWDAFVSSHPEALIYHHSSWLIALEEEYGQKRISLAGVDHDDRVRAVLPLLLNGSLPFEIGRH